MFKQRPLLYQHDNNIMHTPKQSVPDNWHVWLIQFVIYTNYEHWGISRRSGNDNLLCSSIYVCLFQCENDVSFFFIFTTYVSQCTFPHLWWQLKEKKSCIKAHTTEGHAYLIMASLGLYFSSFTPITYIGASADGAEMTTFFAPPSKWACM